MAWPSRGGGPPALVPSDKFGAVEPGVYRSAFPNPESFGHLKLLSLRTVINLSQEALTRAATSFFLENHVLLVDVGLQVWTHPSCAPISHELVKEAMRYVLDATHHPLLVMSSSGTHQVGALVGCLRRLQNWNLASALDEYRSYAAPSPRLFCEQFIELWDCDLLTLPATLPAWFERQQALLEDDGERWRRRQQQRQLLRLQQGGAAAGGSGTLACCGTPSAACGGGASAPIACCGSADSLREGSVAAAPQGEDAAYFRVVGGPLVPPGCVTSLVDTWDD